MGCTNTKLNSKNDEALFCKYPPSPNTRLRHRLDFVLEKPTPGGCDGGGRSEDSPSPKVFTFLPVMEVSVSPMKNSVVDKDKEWHGKSNEEMKDEAEDQNKESDEEMNEREDHIYHGGSSPSFREYCYSLDTADSSEGNSEGERTESTSSGNRMEISSLDSSESLENSSRKKERTKRKFGRRFAKNGARKNIFNVSKCYNPHYTSSRNPSAHVVEKVA